MMITERILVVDADPLSRKCIVEAVTELGYEVLQAASSSEALACAGSSSPDLVLVDVHKNGAGIDGFALVKDLRARHPELSSIAVAAENAVDSAVQALRAGANEVLMKPWTPDAIEIVIDRLERVSRLERENQYLRQEISGGAPPEMIAKSPAMILSMRAASRLARSRGAVLIRGESGSGKNRLAQFIHLNSPRAERPFIRIKCAQFPGSLLEAELFGREQGPFAGPVRLRTGRFELAHGGTILFEGISDVSLDMQQKLLEVLDRQEIRRVGSSRPIAVDVRILATTTRDLLELTREKRFNEELCTRFKAMEVQVPSLRERAEDVLPLARHFADHFGRTSGLGSPRFTQDALDRMASCNWPGNVSELEDAVEHAVVSLRKTTIHGADLGLGTGSTAGPLATGRTETPVPITDLGPSLANRPMEEIERVAILATLHATGGNKTEAARRLGLTARTLSNKMKLWRAAGLVA